MSVAFLYCQGSIKLNRDYFHQANVAVTFFPIALESRFSVLMCAIEGLLRLWRPLLQCLFKVLRLLGSDPSSNEEREVGSSNQYRLAHRTNKQKGERNQTESRERVVVYSSTGGRRINTICDCNSHWSKHVISCA